MQSVFCEWGISEDKVSFYVTDSGSNIVKALKECVVEYTQILELEEGMEQEDELDAFEEGDPNLDASFIEDEIQRDSSEFQNLEREHRALCLDIKSAYPALLISSPASFATVLMVHQFSNLSSSQLSN